MSPRRNGLPTLRELADRLSRLERAGLGNGGGNPAAIAQLQADVAALKAKDVVHDTEIAALTAQVSGLGRTFLEGSRLTTTGHSFGMCTIELNGDGASSEASVFTNRVAGRYRMVPDIRSQAGSQIASTVEYLITGNSGPRDAGGLSPKLPNPAEGGDSAHFHRPWTPDDVGIVLVDPMRNDVACWGPSGGAGDPNSVAVPAYKVALRTILRWLRVGAVTDFAPSGSFATLGTMGHASGCLYTSTPGATIPFTWTGQEAFFTCLLGRDDLNYGQLEVVYAGNAIKTIDNGNGFPRQPSGKFDGDIGPGYCWQAVRLSTADAPFSTGTNTVTLRKKTGDSNPVVIDCGFTPRAYPPLVYVIGDPDPATYLQHETAGAYTEYRAAIAAVCAEAEFSGYARSLEIAGWDPSTMMGIFHPNDKGNAAFADTIAAAIEEDLIAFTPGVHL